MEDKKVNPKRDSKEKLVIDKYLDENGCSEIIVRDELKSPLSWTSGDSAFRSDSSLARQYKYFRFCKNLNFSNCSKCWNLSDDDKVTINKIHSELEWKRNGRYVEYIQFFGKLEKNPDDKLIRLDIRIEICKRNCAHCGSNKSIQVDHKNDLKNDKRILNLETQTIDMFQALCHSCNCRKREIKRKTKNQVKSGN